MNVTKWLEVVVGNLVDSPEAVVVTEDAVGDALHLQIHTADGDQRKLTGPTYQSLKQLVWAAGKQAGRRYFIEAHIGTNREWSTPAANRIQRISPADSDPGTIAWEFLSAAKLAPETLDRANVMVMSLWAGTDWPEVRAYMLAQYGETMPSDALQAFRRGGDNG